MATTTVLIDKLLTTVIQLKASDLHISCGQPPQGNPGVAWMWPVLAVQAA